MDGPWHYRKAEQLLAEAEAAAESVNLNEAPSRGSY